MKKKVVSTGVKLTAAVALLMASGCAEWHKRSFDNTKCKGSKFTHALAEEYRMMGETEQMIMFDDLDADLWYRKGIKAKIGCEILPEYLDGWRIRNDKIPELADAREMLITAMEYGARNTAPEMTAHAQAHYDCWVEQSEEGWQLGDIRACRDEFYKAMHEVENMMMNNVVQGPSVHAVLFKLDKHDLDAEAHNVIDDAMKDASMFEKGRMIELVGHTDKVGSASHNKKLAEYRAMAVKDEIVKRGFPAEMITIKIMGEHNQSKHIDEDYRRVDIKFMDPMEPMHMMHKGGDKHHGHMEKMAAHTDNMADHHHGMMKIENKSEK